MSEDIRHEHFWRDEEAARADDMAFREELVRRQVWANTAALRGSRVDSVAQCAAFADEILEEYDSRFSAR